MHSPFRCIYNLLPCCFVFHQTCIGDLTTLDNIFSRSWWWFIETKMLKHRLSFIFTSLWITLFFNFSLPPHICGTFNKFPDFFVQAFKIVVDFWQFTMLLLYILWDDWPIFMISDSNEQLQQEFEYTLLKPDCHSWWSSKIQSGREDTLEERYAIKYCFKHGKNGTETYGMLQTAFWPSCMNRVSVFEWHKRFEEARESVRGWWEVWEE